MDCSSKLGEIKVPTSLLGTSLGCSFVNWREVFLLLTLYVLGSQHSEIINGFHLNATTFILIWQSRLRNVQGGLDGFSTRRIVDAQTRSLSCVIPNFSDSYRSRMSDSFVISTPLVLCHFPVCATPRAEYWSEIGGENREQLENRSDETHLDRPRWYLPAGLQHLMSSPRRVR